MHGNRLRGLHQCILRVCVSYDWAQQYATEIKRLTEAGDRATAVAFKDSRSRQGSAVGSQDRALRRCVQKVSNCGDGPCE